MRVLADHCVTEGIVLALRREGITVLRVVDIADPRASDKSVVALASQHEAVLLTADADFQNRRDFQPRRYGGIILLKDLQVAPDRVLRRLLRLLAGEQRGLAGTLTILDRRSARVRR